ncbi:restriction endonuclease subunit S [uncultured Christiangramia sp.]|uniref:restriction endonuclease subunit S n=1 Tax=uncultured Christiangramia sp. TaxID=503836 RepID=UPI00260D8D2A|nr:restriction endonuclease subunit S [uncultured Christiangramia sp.]
MEAILEKKLEFEKSEWKPVKFGDVVREPKESIKDPESAGVEYVLGLEHIEPEDIHLRSFNTLEDSTTFTKAFKKGDVLFGRRRAYLKKAARAEFDGICSGDITVFRAKENLLPELLPFIVNNDKFFDWAVKHSAGGLSPRVKFKDLVKYEFLLPPKDQQAQLAELLWSMDDLIEKDNLVLEKLNRSYSTTINQFMIHGEYSKDGELIRTKCGLLDKRIDLIQLKDCLREKPSYGANASSKVYNNNEEPRYIRITDIDDEGNLIPNDKVSIDSKNYDQYILENDDFLFARTGNTVGKTLLYKSDMEPAVFAGYLIRFKLNPQKLNPKFLFYFSKSLKYESFKRKMIKVGAQPNINSVEYQSMFLPFFSIDLQKNICDKLDSIKSNIHSLKSKIEASNALKRSLINQIF